VRGANERFVQDAARVVGDAGDMTEPAFTPALGRFAPVRFYDAVAALVRERLWRALVVGHVAARADDVVVDVGCGTGSLALLVRNVRPRARIVGVDPDPEVLAVARRKADAAGVAIEWRAGMGDALEVVVDAGSADVVVSSLVLHHCSMAMKRSMLSSMHDALAPGGRLVIADYGWQRTRAMRLAFRVVQLADGVEDTQPNADGVVPGLIAEAGFRDVREVEVVATITGSISIYVAERPARPSGSTPSSRASTA
jgi:SAM-dependent methyltransferase